MKTKPTIENEKRTEKLTMALTKTTVDNVRDLSHLHRESVAQYISKLIQREVEANAEKLEMFRKMTEEPEELQKK